MRLRLRAARRASVNRRAIEPSLAPAPPPDDGAAARAPSAGHRFSNARVLPAAQSLGLAQRDVEPDSVRAGPEGTDIPQNDGGDPAERAVLRPVRERASSRLQAKLEISQPGDPDEREADEVADRV